MLSFFSFSVVLCVLLEGLSASNHEIWQKFKQTHGKDYHPHMEAKRRIVFEENIKKINDHNLKADLGQVSFKLGLNPFSDMSHEEFVKSMNGYKKSSNDSALSSLSLHQVQGSSLQLPAEIDWVKKGLVSKVYNQGTVCGSCWTFSTAGAVESAIAMKTGKLVPLSAQHILDCSRARGNYGCNGGEPALALQWTIDNKGIDTEQCNFYKGRRLDCRERGCTVGGSITSYKRVPKGDEEALKDALAKVGPMSIAMDASHYSLQSYESGIYNERECNPDALDHAVVLVGYGSENGKDYWLVKNSWGDWWGENGYFKMARNVGNMCGVATEAFYAIA